MSDDLFEYEINAVEEAADAIVDLIERAVAAAVASYFYYPDDDKRAAQAVTAVPSWSLTRAERLINECGHRFRGMAADLRNAADETGLDFGTIARLRAMNAERAAKVDLRTAAFFHELEALVSSSAIMPKRPW
ncbi:MAG: hypothetical protein HY332_23930 [Chloroflexi bacterium]|nr:hypothetical protein [Chloroflexota bacterium]